MTALNLARPDDLDRLLPLARALHEELGKSTDDAQLTAALSPLLDGSPHGAVYTMGPRRAPIGYVVVTFGWSIEHGGLEGWIDEMFIRPGVRGRGLGGEVLANLPKALADAGLTCLSLLAPRADDRLQRLYTRARFQPRAGDIVMTRVL